MNKGKGREGRIFIGVWIPNVLVKALDEATVIEDSDRSKFLRRAVTERIARIKKEAA